jgi:hypothetical protein
VQALAAHPVLRGNHFHSVGGSFALHHIVVGLTYFSSLALSTATVLLYSQSRVNNSLFLSLLLSGADVAGALNNAMSLSLSRLTTILLLILNLLLSPNIRAQQFLHPPTIPLAVRSPYLNCWLQCNRTLSTEWGHTWPTNSNISQVCHSHIFYGHEILNFSVRPWGGLSSYVLTA